MGDVRRSANGTMRDIDEPSATLTSSMDNGNYRWLATGTNTEIRRRSEGEGWRDTSVPFVREIDEPAPTLTQNSRLWSWVHERPATPVQGDPRIFAPGHRCREAGCCEGKVPEPMMSRSVRVTPVEAAVLQSFRADYPWQGTKTSQHSQIGNAVPPLLAAAIFRAIRGQL